MSRTRRKRDALDYFRFDSVGWLTSPDVTRMTAAQEGAFIRLLALASRDKQCSLADDDGALATLSKLGPEWATAGALVREQFEPHPTLGGRLINRKLFSEWSSAWASYRERCKRNRQNRLKAERKHDQSSTDRAPVVDQSSTTGGVKGTVKGKGKGTVAIATKKQPSAPAAPASWSAEAIDIWLLRFPDAVRFKDELLGNLKPLVQKLGWRSPRGGGVGIDFRSYVLDRKTPDRMISAAAFVKRYRASPVPGEQPKGEEAPIATSTPEAEQAWAKLLVQLEAKLQPWPFATYFRPTYGVSLQPDKLLIVAAPLEQTRQTIQKNYGQLVSEVARSAGFVAVKFVVGRRAFGGV